MDGIKGLADGIAEEFKRLLPKQRKTQRNNLSLLVATMLDVRSANLMDLAAGLPRDVERIDRRYQWIARVLMNPRIDPDAVIAPFAREVLVRLAAEGQPIVLILDQSKLSDRHQVLMLAVRHGERALPLLWRVAATKGAIGFAVQKALLEAAAPLLPEGAKICLMADRFYGTAELIALCQDRTWDYRLRLKGNRVVRNAENRITTGQMAEAGVFTLENVHLTAKKATTNLGLIHDPGHPEPWIVAMPAKPGDLTTLDYSGRWAIEPMFSDFKSRGFGVEDTQSRRHPNPAPRPTRPPPPGHGAGALYRRLDRTLGRRNQSHARRKKHLKRQPKKLARSKISFFTRGLRYITRGLRYIAHLILYALPLPPLWKT